MGKLLKEKTQWYIGQPTAITQLSLLEKTNGCPHLIAE